VQAHPTIGLPQHGVLHQELDDRGLEIVRLMCPSCLCARCSIYGGGSELDVQNRPHNILSAFLYFRLPFRRLQPDNLIAFGNRGVVSPGKDR
jgi:hypothetical protein